MASNRDRAAEIIAPWFEKEWGHPEDNAESAADALDAAGVLAPDLPPKHEWDDVVLIPREGKATVIKDVFTETSYSIDGARMHALDLLAAADHAETEVTDD